MTDLSDIAARSHDLLVSFNIQMGFLVIAMTCGALLSFIPLPDDPRAAGERVRIVKLVPWLMGVVAIPLAIISTRLHARAAGGVDWVLVALFVVPPGFAWWSVRRWEPEKRSSRVRKEVGSAAEANAGEVQTHWTESGEHVVALAFDLTADDFAAFDAHHALTSESALRRLRRARLGAAVLGALVGFGFVLFFDFGVLSASLAAAWSAVVSWFAYGTRRGAGLTRPQRWLARAGALGASESAVLTLDDSGVREDGAGIHLFAKWNGIKRVDSTTEHVFIYFLPHAAFIVPRSVGEDAVEALLRVVEARRVTP